MTTVDTVVALALAAGAVGFTLVAVVGLYRLPDCYSRAHATSKSDTLGALLAVLAAVVAFDTPTAVVKLAALFVFLLLTAPTAAHAIIRSADDQGVDPWTRGGDDAGSPAAADGDAATGSGGEGA